MQYMPIEQETRSKKLALFLAWDYQMHLLYRNRRRRNERLSSTLSMNAEGVLDGGRQSRRPERIDTRGHRCYNTDNNIP